MHKNLHIYLNTHCFTFIYSLLGNYDTIRSVVNQIFNIPDVHYFVRFIKIYSCFRKYFWHCLINYAKMLLIHQLYIKTHWHYFVHIPIHVDNDYLWLTSGWYTWWNQNNLQLSIGFVMYDAFWKRYMRLKWYLATL